jgi:hypothetical protein
MRQKKKMGNGNRSCKFVGEIKPLKMIKYLFVLTYISPFLINKRFHFGTRAVT